LGHQIHRHGDCERERLREFLPLICPIQ